MRTALALVCGAVTAFVCAAILGEYSVTVPTGIAAGVVVPAVVGEVVRLVTRRSEPWRTAAPASLLGAGAVALGVWFASGRGLQPWPAGGSVAVALAAVWPVGAAALVTRSRAAEQLG